MAASFTDRFAQHRAAVADIADCREMLSENSRTFFAASLLLPREVREPATALYAFCRLADDAVDLHGGQMDAVASLRERLERIYAGRPINHPADRAFADVVVRFAIPQALPEALLEGFEWDAQARRYEDLPGIFDYATRVAGTVGAMMSLLMGARTADALARATDLGVAMQISNIARDVGEDARAGRIYLPLGWMREVGIVPEEWLERPVFTPELGEVVKRLLKAGDELYDRVGAGVALLPAGCHPGINAARFLYAEIGREVERFGHDSISRRATVPAMRKARLLASALTAPLNKSGVSLPPLEQCRFLVDAVVRTCPAASAPDEQLASQRPTTWGLEDRVGWLLELFERLERHDRPAYGMNASAGETGNGGLN
jgi:phytoene synthase